MLTGTLTVTPHTPALGSFVTGVDLGGPLDDATLGEIRAAFNERAVVFFPDQHLDPEQFMAFARRFGPLTASNLADDQLVEGYGELGEVRKNENDTLNIGGRWHSDQSYREHPNMATMLIARKLPSSGGDTMFINLGLAFEGLSEGLKRTLRALRGVYVKDESERELYRRPGTTDGRKGYEWEAIHPIVGRHPETGREILYADPKYTQRFDGWTRAESAGLLNVLFEHVQRPEYGCRFHWSVGTLAIWDNRQCLHYALNDYHGEQRIMHRAVVQGPFLQ
jgi:taurine dioxygenase